MTPAEALATATLAPAKLVGQDATTGSIKVGKVADWCWSKVILRSASAMFARRAW